MRWMSDFKWALVAIVFGLIAVALMILPILAITGNKPSESFRLRCEYNLPDITPGFRVIDLECVVLSGDGP